MGAREAFLDRVRGSGLDDLGQPAVRFRSAQGGEPLRDQLRRAAPGEAVLLGSASLFDAPSPFREFGPVYVSAELVRVRRAPEMLFQSDYFRTDLVLRRYDQRRWIAAASRVTKQEAPARIEEWLSSADTAFVDARFSEYGCFGCRFMRATGSVGEPERAVR